MTQIWGEDGVAKVVTVVSAGPITVTQVKTPTKDGYSSVQVGYSQLKEKKVGKRRQGKPFRHLREVKGPAVGSEEVASGTIFDAGVFAAGDTVRVSGISKGKGFQGVVKRHGFSGGPRSHGQKHSEREPGAIGGGGGRAGGRVAKGIRMAGRMGGERVSVRNLKVVGVDEAKQTILLSGAVPGRRGTLLEIVSTD